MAFATLTLATSEAVHAESFYQSLNRAVETNPRVQAAKSDVNATSERIRVTQGGWFPELEVTANKGYEVQNKPALTRTKLRYGEVNVKVTQLLWDFGATNARIEKSRLKLLRSELTLFRTRQEVMLEAVTAAIQIRSALQVLNYARRSESNVRKQTGLEKARVRAGGGLSTDVLQAKTQLAGAQARSIQSLGKRQTALNRYRALFRSAPTGVRTMAILNSVKREVPKTLGQAMRFAFKKNPNLRIAAVEEVLARQTVGEVSRDKFLPKFELVGKSKFSRNTGGTRGRETGSSVQVQLRFPFNLGFTSVNTLRANQSELAAASHRVAAARLKVEEEVRNAWSQYETARRTASLLRDQATLANAFLGLARKERQLGNRSLIDVLAGESALFNAKSDTISMEGDVLVAAFSILKATGQLIPPGTALVQTKSRKRRKSNRWKTLNK